MTRRKVLSTIFTIAASAGIAYGVYNHTRNSGTLNKLEKTAKHEGDIAVKGTQYHDLSHGERKLVTTLFGAEVFQAKEKDLRSAIMSPAGIQKGLLPAGKDAEKLLHEGHPRTIYFTDTTRFLESFDTTQNVADYKAAIHSTMHAVQQQRDAAYNKKAKGPYSLNRDSRLSDFSREQQADIMADYAARFFFQRQPQSKGFIDSVATRPETDQDRLLRIVVEKDFPAAEAGRRVLESKLDRQQEYKARKEASEKAHEEKMKQRQEDRKAKQALKLAQKKAPALKR